MKRFITIALILLVFSCSKGTKNHETDYIIPQDKMTKIFVDFYLAEAAIMEHMQEGTYARDYSQYYYENLFKKYNINREMFLKSLKYYCFDLKKFSEITNSAFLELNKIQELKQQKNI